MCRLSRWIVGAVLVGQSVVPVVMTAANPEVFTGRLTSLPVDATTVAGMRGSGAVTARLDGATLNITGDFANLNTPVIGAHVHRAVPGVRGPVAFDLTVTNGTSGTISGTLTLTPAQAADLRRGWYYVQLQTKGNPDGQIRGWLLKKQE
jgi:hypothetical protein